MELQAKAMTLHLCLISESHAGSCVSTCTEVNDAESMSRGGVPHKACLLPVQHIRRIKHLVGHPEEPLHARVHQDSHQFRHIQSFQMCATISRIHANVHGHMYVHKLHMESIKGA